MAENFTGVVTQSQSLFDISAQPSATLLQLQTIISNPLVGELPTATGMVLTDIATYDRLAHFPEEMYDLRPESHLVRFMKALLGESGVGQLRKRYLLAQLEQSLSSTHFYDLDRFYGSLFGARRGVLGALPIDPMEDVATPDGWDEIAEYDARFRERIIKLAKAITLGGTPMGMQALAEALTGVECDIYEVWSMIDTQGSPVPGRTWAQVDADFATYGVMKPFTWSQIMGAVTFGNLGINARNEFVIRPKTTYNISDPEDAVRRAEDLYGIQRVINVLKPAFTIASVDDTGVAVHQEVPIAGVSADSEFWEVITRVIPEPELEEIYQLLYKAYDRRANPTGVERVQPKPPFSSSQGQQWSYASEVSSVTAFDGAGGAVPGLTGVAQGLKNNTNNYDTITFYDGKKITYRPEYAVIDIKKALAARSPGVGAIVAHPYSGSRKLVPVHG